MRNTLSILLLLLSVSASAQMLTLQGRVVDAETKEPLSYVNIRAGKEATLTNNNGDFKLSAGEDDAVTFSYVGYEKKTVKAANMPSVVRLKPYTALLEEVSVGPVDYDKVLKRTIDNLKYDYRNYGRLARKYFFRTLMEKTEGTFIAEAFMDAYSVVNIRSANITSGLQGSDIEGGRSTLNVNASNIHRLIEVAPMTIDSRFWSNAQKPLQHYSYTREHYDRKFQHLFGEDGESLYRIDFTLKEKWQSEFLTTPYIVGTAYVDAETCRLLRFDGSCMNYFMRNMMVQYPTSINFHLEYDYSQEAASVSNLAISGENSLMLYHALLFALDENKLQTEKMTSSGSNIVTAVKDAGFDSTLWDEYDIVKRTEKEERVAFGKALRPSVSNSHEQEVKRDIPFPEAFRPLMERLSAFGSTIPQEKVFIHMDNTSYQLGDTIWFSAYTRQTNTGKPSDISGVLYVELYGQEGYMIERKLIQIKEGRGNGFFALTSQIQYAGFYELRAYTRWQLNWGCFEHKNTGKLSNYFASKQQEKEYYRDYEKLYSRVFPVYDKPAEPGEYNHDMTLRAMRRIYKDDEKRELRLSLYPEGGNLVEGQPCRIAFEAAWDDGEWAEGKLVYGSDSAMVQNRGRGLFEVVPQKGMEREVLFVAKDGQTAKTELPKAEQTGISLRLEQDSAGWLSHIYNTADLTPDSLALTLMHEGRLMDARLLADLSTKKNGRLYSINDSLLAEAGVYQLTVFDTQGRVFADRLFFSRGKEGLLPTLSIEGLKEEYAPYEKVELKIKAETPSDSPSKGRTKESPLIEEEEVGRGQFSLSVRDDTRRDFLYDNGNILTEMLLSSEIRGFVPQPEWYFEKDDQEHLSALDLLMMTQGWRRFDWRSMAIRGMWDLTQPAEKAPILLGNTFKNINTEDLFLEEKDSKREKDPNNPEEDNGRRRGGQDSYETEPMDLSVLDEGKNSRNDERRARDEREYKKAVNERGQGNPNRKELRVHAELVAVDAEMSFTGDVETTRGGFRIQLPPFYGPSVLFLSVADTTKWKKGKAYTWIQAEPDNEETDYMYLPASRKIRQKIFVEPAEYLGRISWPYPRFVKPYDFYQNHLLPFEEQGARGRELEKFDDATLMREVTVKAKRNTLRRFDDTWPILSIDALEANNIATDCGLGYMQVMVGDYGVGAPHDRGGIEGGEPTFETRYGYGRTRRMLMDKEIPADSIYARKYLISGSFVLTTTQTHGDSGGHFQLSPGESLEYRGTGVWDKYVLYSDYSPRMEGNKQYYGSGEPKTKLVMYPFPDGSRRITYRDRRYILKGFSYPAAFYSPDYSKAELPKNGDGRADYRRTLYWNPSLQLDVDGEANVTFYNNSRQTSLSVEAEGQTADGTLLWSK